MKFLIVGAGALGGYFGARLWEAGEDVTFLVRPHRAEILKEKGLNIKSSYGDIHIFPVPLAITGSLPSHYDVILMAVKAYDLPQAMEDIAPAIGPHTLILPILNGLVHIDRLIERFGESHVLGGKCMISAKLAEDGTIIHLNRLHSLTFGELDGDLSPRVHGLYERCQKAHFDSELSDHILQEMWEKWIFIATLAGMTCLMRASIGDIVTIGAQDLILGLLDECVEIATAYDYAPDPTTLTLYRSLLTDSQSTLMASMLMDMERQGRIEADHIIGELLKCRPEGSTSLSFLRMVYAHLKAYEERRRRDNQPH